MRVICVMTGGPDRSIIDSKGRKWVFEDHPYCGPTVLDKRGNPADRQPPEGSPFWDAVTHWYAQGKRTECHVPGEVWCIWEQPAMPRMRHLGGRHYMLILDNEGKSQKEPK